MVSGLVPKLSDKGFIVTQHKATENFNIILHSIPVDIESLRAWYLAIAVIKSKHYVKILVEQEMLAAGYLHWF